MDGTAVVEGGAPAAAAVEAPQQSNVDRALEQFRATETPAAAETPAVNPPVAESAQEQVVADPLEGLKDNPRVVELLAAEEQHKAYQEVLGSHRYNVGNPEELGQQLGDAALLYDIASGKAPATAILDVMMNNEFWTPEQKQAVMSQLAEYIGKATGKPVAAAAAGQQFTDPIQKELAEIKSKLGAKEQQEQKAQQDAEQEKVNKAYSSKIDELCKDFKDDSQYYADRVGAKIAGNPGIVAQIAKGNFAQVVKMFHDERNADVKRFERWNAALIAKKQGDAAGLPKLPNGGTPATSAAAQPTVFKTDEERKEFALKQFKGQQ